MADQLNSGILAVLFLAATGSTTSTASNRDLGIQCNGSDPHAAVAACTSLIEENQDIADLELAAVYYDRGNAEIELDDQGAAFADFNQAIELRPDFDFALRNRVMIYDSRGEYELAVTDFTKAIAMSPEVRGHYYNRARLPACRIIPPRRAGLHGSDEALARIAWSVCWKMLCVGC
jgi:tetratricopeptide (TPR) repeat protein